MSNTRDFQIFAIEQLSKIFTKADDNLKSTTDHPQQQAEKTAASVPRKLHPGWTKYIASVHPNVIEDEEGKEPTNYQHKVHIYPPGPRIIPPEVPIPPPRVNTALPPSLDKRGPSSNYISRGNKDTRPRYALTSQCQRPKANSVTHKISGVAQEYRHLIKVPERKIWEKYFANKLGQLAQGIREVKGTNTVMFITKFKVPEEKKVTYGKIVCEVKPEK